MTGDRRLILPCKVGDQIYELRQMALADTGALFALVEQDREHMRPWDEDIDKNYTSLETTRDRIRDSLVEDFPFGIWTPGGVLVGMVCLRQIDDLTDLVCNLHYWVAKAHCGKGIGTAACGGIIAWALVHLDPGIIVKAGVRPGNLASRQVLLKNSFVRWYTTRRWHYFERRLRTGADD